MAHLTFTVGVCRERREKRRETDREIERYKHTHLILWYSVSCKAGVN